MSYYLTWLDQSSEESKVEKKRLIPQTIELKIVMDIKKNSIRCFALINPYSELPGGKIRFRPSDCKKPLWDQRAEKIDIPEKKQEGENAGLQLSAFLKDGIG